MVRKSQRRTRLSLEILESRNLQSGVGPTFGTSYHYLTPNPPPILAGVQPDLGSGSTSGSGGSQTG